MAAKTAAGVQAGTGQAQRGTVTLSAAAGQGGQHALAAELLLFIAIVGVRSVAQYGPGDKKDLPADQYSPMYILGAGFAVYFVLSFLAARGGNSAKLAVACGFVFDLALLLKSAPHLELIAAQYAAPRRYVKADESGSYQTGQAAVLSPALQYEDASGKLPPVPKGKSASSAMNYARKSLTAAGLSAAQWPDLVKLWTAESHWNYKAVNPSTGAAGIPQALPADKMASAGADWKTNPFTQIRWGLGYIRQRYGSISAAWAHEQHFGWY